MNRRKCVVGRIIETNKFQVKHLSSQTNKFQVKHISSQTNFNTNTFQFKSVQFQVNKSTSYQLGSNQLGICETSCRVANRWVVVVVVVVVIVVVIVVVVVVVVAYLEVFLAGFPPIWLWYMWKCVLL
jgi:hypothetical protein